MRLLLILALLIPALAASAAAASPGPPARPVTMPQLPPDYAERVADLERRHQGDPANPEIVDALASSYAMAAHYDQATRLLEAFLASAPGRYPDLLLKLARNQSWAGRTSSAIRSYRTYLRARPTDRTATVELIRLHRYRGDYSEAEKLCDKLLASNAADAEVLALKAETLHWAGHRGRLARETADRAAQASAASPDVKIAQVYALRDLGENRRAIQEFQALSDHVSRTGGLEPQASYADAYRLLEDDLAHPAHLTGAPAYSNYNDSDGIHDSFWGLHLEAPVRSDHKLLFNLGQYRSSAPLEGIFTAGRDTASVSEFSAGGAVRIAPAVYLTMLGGASRRESEGGLRPIFDFRMDGSPLDHWTFDFESSREFLKVTPRSIDQDVLSYRIGGGVQYAFDSRTSLALHADRRYWSDQNRSVSGDATFRRVLHYQKPFMIDAGLLGHWEQFDLDTEATSGFFTPDRYQRYDGFLGIHGEIGRWLIYEARGAGGAQQVVSGANYRPDWEISSSVGVRLSRALRLSANYQRRNYSLLSRDGWYQGFFVSLSLRQ